MLPKRRELGCVGVLVSDQDRLERAKQKNPKHQRTQEWVLKSGCRSEVFIVAKGFEGRFCSKA
jgi:hypothetical protein